jgi:hypothetical protein
MRDYEAWKLEHPEETTTVPEPGDPAPKPEE